MFNFLNEIVDPNYIRLTDTQQAVLLTIAVAQTPELAYEATSDGEYGTASKEYLLRALLITISGNQARVTSNGDEVLSANGLIDETGEISESGKELLDQYATKKYEMTESLIPFRTLKSL